MHSHSVRVLKRLYWSVNKFLFSLMSPESYIPLSPISDKMNYGIKRYRKTINRSRQ